jgi:hypothetical protein
MSILFPAVQRQNTAKHRDSNIHNRTPLELKELGENFQSEVS